MLEMDQKLRLQGFAENKSVPKGTYTIWNYMVYTMDRTHGLHLYRLINEFITNIHLLNLGGIVVKEIQKFFIFLLF